ncbi:N-carbamoylputrescine amidase [Platanthera guangdongensis]|uniref:N-carbamoylputrescine amidase n=1 Tax=Platanthera guangdongensis TaxID=2320717 RepID=A0ABR2MHP5_9ASPA
MALANDKDEAILTAEFNLDRIKNHRHSWGVFRDRRPDLYQALLTLDGSKKSSTTRVHLPLFIRLCLGEFMMMNKLLIEN